MKHLILKKISLLILVLFSAQSMADSPWASHDKENETPVEPMPESIAEPIVEPVAEEPAPIDESMAKPEPIAVQEEPAAPQQEEIYNPETYTATQQQGDVLSVNDADQVAPVRVLNFPLRGMSIEKVENELGRPAEIIPPVGQPPISRWVYDDRTVYFEYSTVLHVVAK